MSSKPKIRPAPSEVRPPAIGGRYRPICPEWVAYFRKVWFRDDWIVEPPTRDEINAACRDWFGCDLEELP